MLDVTAVLTKARVVVLDGAPDRLENSSDTAPERELHHIRRKFCTPI